MEAYKAGLYWSLQTDGSWAFDFDPHSHFHLFCSEKGDHTGPRRRDDPRMKFFGNELPEELMQIVSATKVGDR